MGKDNTTEFIELMVSLQKISDEAWVDLYDGQVKNAILGMYKPEIIKEHIVTDIIINPNPEASRRFLVKFKKRYRPLTDEQLFEQFGVKIEDDD